MVMNLMIKGLGYVWRWISGVAFFVFHDGILILMMQWLACFWRSSLAKLFLILLCFCFVDSGSSGKAVSVMF